MSLMNGDDDDDDARVNPAISGSGYVVNASAAAYSRTSLLVGEIHVLHCCPSVLFRFFLS